ncbi:MAG: hypothetical protein SF162_01245 [bacterium]|nr:hypothetical protein [bacterium]
MNWLMQRCKDVGIETQQELASKLQLAGFDYSRSAVSSWMTGARNPPLDDPEFRRVLARILRLTPKEILKLAGYEVEEDHSQAGERAAAIVDQLPPDKQELAISVLEQFLAKT